MANATPQQLLLAARHCNEARVCIFSALHIVPQAQDFAMLSLHWDLERMELQLGQMYRYLTKQAENGTPPDLREGASM